MLWYSLEVPQGGTSKEYPQHMISWRNNQSTESTGGRLFLSVGWEDGPEQGLKTESFNP